MSYIGRTTNKSSDIRRFNATSSTSATHTLTWTAPNEQSLLVTINGVKQQEDAYSVSGTILTLTSALVSTDKLEVIGINDIGTVITPAQNSVDADKLSSSVNAEIAANTAKVTNATHTGDVTGATALTIAADAVDIAMLSATGTASSSTFLRGDNAWAEVSPKPNFLLNSTFEVAQRGTSFTPTNGSGASLMYTLDRWYGYRSTSTAIMQQISDGTSPDGFRCHARMGRTDSTTDAGYFIIGQQIETKNACALAGQTVCLSMWVRKHANFSGDWGIYVTTGTGVDQTAWNSIGGGWTGGASAYSSTTVLSDVTTSWVRRSISFSIASGVKEIAIKNHFSSFSGSSVTNDYVEVAGVQLEIGSVATPFEHKSYGQELQDCQRYYEKSYNQGSNPGSATAVGAWMWRHTDAGPGVNTVSFQTPKRTTPTVVSYGRASGTSGKITNMSGGAADTTATAFNTGECSVTFSWTSTGSETYVEGHWTADAEL